MKIYGWSASELEKMPTLCVGQADDLKIDEGNVRIWLSRCGPEDGETYDNKISVETLCNGRWEMYTEYSGAEAEEL